MGYMRHECTVCSSAYLSILLLEPLLCVCGRDRPGVDAVLSLTELLLQEEGDVACHCGQEILLGLPWEGDSTQPQVCGALGQLGVEHKLSYS